MDISPGGSSCPLFPRGIGIWKDGFSGEGKPEDPEKNPQSKDENLQQTQLTSDTTGSGIEPGPQGWEVSALTLRRPGSPSFSPEAFLLILSLVFNIKIGQNGV